MSAETANAQKPNSENPSALSQGNKALREKKFAVAVAFYLQALEASPGMSKAIAANLAMARRNYKAAGKASGRTRVAVCGWELSHNAAGRVYMLSKLYETFADVEIIGCILSKYGKDIWEPIRGTAIPIHSFVVEQESRFLEQALELVAAHPYDVVHLSKPRAPNLLIGVLYKLIWDARVIVDIDDEELSFVGCDEAISIDDYVKSHGSLPPLKNLGGPDWTRLAVGSAKEFDGVTVSNPVLQRRYGGEIVRHARDEKLFKPSPERKCKHRRLLGIPENKKVVLFFGTPRAHKGLLETADAIRSLKRDDVVLAIIGDFPDPALKAQLLEKGGVDYFFLGNQPFERIPDIVAAGDYCVLLQDPASPVAQFQVPAKLSDALGMGLVVFANDLPSLSDLATQGAVVTVTPDSLAPNLAKIIKDEDLAHKANKLALAMFATEMSFAANAPRLRAVLDEGDRKAASVASAENRFGVLLESTRLSFLLSLSTYVPHESGDDFNSELRQELTEKPALIHAEHQRGRHISQSEMMPLELKRDGKVPGGIHGDGAIDDTPASPEACWPTRDLNRVAIVVHYFYPEIWPIISKLLKALTYPFDLFVTAPADKAETVVGDVLQDFPTARLHFGPNHGMDILPFLSLIPTLRNERYLAICKLHTKRGDGALATIWRDIMLESLIGSNDVVEQVAQAFRNNSGLCLAGPAVLFQSGPRLMYENMANLRRSVRTVYSKGVPGCDWGFFAGTMFWVRTEVLDAFSRFANFSFGYDDTEYRKDGKLEHALERFFGLLPHMHEGTVGLIHQRSTAKHDCCLVVGEALAGIGKADIGNVMRQFERLEQDVALISGSGLFDKEYYYEGCPEIRGTEADCIVHYLTQGTFRGIGPNRYFVPNEYRALHRDVVGSHIEPFVHYLSCGAKEGRRYRADRGVESDRQPYFRLEALNASLIDWKTQATRETDAPDVSIIIPVYGQLELTKACLESLTTTPVAATYEIVCVDNGSDEHTAGMLREAADADPRIILIVNPENYNFALGCNLGFSNSKGSICVFLNSDTTVTPEWLDRLIAPLSDTSIAAVQPKLAFPDDTIQCAGIVFSQWSSLGYPIYAGTSICHPHVNISRRYQAVTAACMAVRRSDFAEARGFDPRFLNGQEDVDLCLRLTKRSRSCWYEAGALVYHHEGKSSGRGRYITHNRREFVSRWMARIKPDDQSFYRQDGFLVSGWVCDSPEHLKNGIEIYRPILSDGQEVDDADDSEANAPSDCAQPFQYTPQGFEIVPPARDRYFPGGRPVRDSMVNVLVCAHSAGKELFGGERSFLDILDALQNMAVNVFVTLPDIGGLAYLSAVTSRCCGIYSFQYIHWKRGAAPSQPAIARFRSIARRHSIALIHANTIMLREPLIAARAEGIPCLVHARELIMQDETLARYIGLSGAAIVDQVLSSSDFVVANSVTTAREFDSQARTFIAPNVVMVDDFDLENRVVPTRITFGLISSNVPKKGIYDLIEVARLCESSVPNAIFLLIGPDSGPDVRDIERLKRDQLEGKVPANVVFAGYIDTPQAAVTLVNVVLNLSWVAESFGRTVAEALAARRPVIAYDWGALPELVADGTSGYLVKYRDVQAVANRVRHLCSNAHLINQLGEAGRAFVVANFSPRVLSQGLDSAYSDILSSSEPLRSKLKMDEHALTLIRTVRQRFRVPVKAITTRVTVIVPVHNAYQEVLNCLRSVLAYTEFVNTRLLIIDDGSSDPRIGEELVKYEGVEGVDVRRNGENLGYTRSVNWGIEIAGGNDVVLLNSDTIVTPQWLLGLRLAAFAKPNIGTVTAMSDNAGAFSFPVAGKPNPKPKDMGYAEYAQRMIDVCARSPLLELPTGNGFCMYIRRELISSVGYFDDAAFPRGYGEENDFCMRGLKKGFLNVLSPWAFVFHIRTASFQGEKEKLVEAGADMLRILHPDYERLVQLAFSSKDMSKLRVDARKVLA